MHTELKRRLTIGLNLNLSVDLRNRLVTKGVDLKEISSKIPSFRFFEKEVEDIVVWLEKDERNSIIWYGQDSYPEFEPLRSRIPYFFLCQGSRPSSGSRCVGIVGTRHASYDGLHQSFRFGLEAGLAGYHVASGFAEGIDQAAMIGCISAAGPCLGILACGHEVEYPSLTKNLRREILDSSGCVLSMFPPKTNPYKSNFVNRNMIIAAYSTVLVAVQAPKESGTLITCDYAMQMGKDLLVGMSGLGERNCQSGTSRLAFDGASAIDSLSEFYPDIRRVCEIDCNGYRFGDKSYMVTPYQ